MRPAPRLILALDVDTLSKARFFVDNLSSRVKIFKIGPVMFTAYGPKIIELIHKKGREVFLDLKYHDIPNTVANAIRQAVRLKVKMVTLHTAGGMDMLRAAAQAAREEAKTLKIKKPVLLGVTVLTSDKGGTDTAQAVLKRAQLAQKSGLDGIVCSVHEAAAVRKACGKDFIIVTPGIRPAGIGADDQKRTATPGEAIKAGASYIVVGRPILEAADPLKAAEGIVKELA